MGRKNSVETRQRVILEALKLFAAKGFDSVSLAEIATASEITPMGLYKHFPSKQSIIDAIMEISDKGFHERMEEMKVDFDEHPEPYVNMSESEQMERLKQLFLHTLDDELPALMRKLMTVEQFHIPEFADVYNERYCFSQFREHESLFGLWMKKGRMKKTDAHLLSVEYISPVIVMINICDRTPDYKENALMLIEAHVKEFNKHYMVK